MPTADTTKMVTSSSMLPTHTPSQTIPMSTLVDLAVQRTYDELTHLSEVLPSKADQKRKIAIVQFASRTRQLFIRLLALVKWATSARKVDNCSDILAFLEQQSMLFIDTADYLARMSRETLVNARLPNFSVPCAVDVLTTGTYPRLPACIRNKIVPPDPISAVEKSTTLKRLNQVIEYRLVASDLPLQMRRLRIENGKVKFIVEHEFEATLTLMGDSLTIPWRLLNINFLVEDHETGDGKNLVHSLQVHYIHQLIQHRLVDSERPIHDLYHILHSFCQSLQLEVLHSQTKRLINQRLGDYIRIEEYNIGRSLTVSYWKELKREDKSGEIVQGHKVSVYVSTMDPSKPLQINHSPALAPDDSTKVGLAVKSDHLSLEKLLVHSMQVWSYTRLKELSSQLKCYLPVRAEIQDLPPVLCISLLTPCLPCEMLRVGINLQHGIFIASMPLIDDPLIKEIEDGLNNDGKNIEKCFTKLRQLIGMVRCEKSVQHLSATCHRTLPLANLAGHKLESIAHEIIYISIPRQSLYYVVVHLDVTQTKTINYKYYLLEVSRVETDDGPDTSSSDETVFKCLLNADRLISLDIFAITRGPHTKLVEEKPEMDSLTRKRKLILGDRVEPIRKKPKASPYFVVDISFLLTNIEEKLAFVLFVEELDRRGVSHSGIQVDEEGVCLNLVITALPDTKDCYPAICQSLQRSLLSCTVRIITRPTRNFLIDFAFCNCPITGKLDREQGPIQRVYFQVDIANVVISVDSLLSEWTAIAHLYVLVSDFAPVYKSGSKGEFSTLTIQSYDFRRLVFIYGTNQTEVMSVFWRSADKKYHLQPGLIGNSLTSSCHTPVLLMLENLLNKSCSLTRLAQILCMTASPMSALSMLSIRVLYNFTAPKNHGLNFTLIPQTLTHIRLVFRKTFVLDIHLKPEKLIGVRDGAFSLFDGIPGLKAFLNLFVDESVYASYTRQRSSAEDDNPPSPVCLDAIDSLFMPQSVGSPAMRLTDTARFHSPVTPPSNPHTPASPGGSKLSHLHGYSSPAAAFPLASPPSVPPHPIPSPAQLIGTPSPAQLCVGSPSQPQLHMPSPGFAATPSPAQAHLSSPAPPFITSQGSTDTGSPFTSSSLAMPPPSPRLGSSMSPGYASLQSPQTHRETDHRPQPSNYPLTKHPSRTLPQKMSATTVSTLLSHEAFTRLLTPVATGVEGILCSPLEKFLSCVLIKVHMKKFIHNEESLSELTNPEPGILMFKGDSLQYRIALQPTTMQSLHLKSTPVRDTREQWLPDQLQYLEKFFEHRVVCAPYKFMCVHAFLRILGTPTHILKDCIQLMKHELSPPDRNMKWSVQICLNIPHGTNLAPVGTPALVYKNNKVFLMLQFTYIGSVMPPGSDPPSVVAPFTYDNNTNRLSLMEPRAQSGVAMSQTPAFMALNTVLIHFYNYRNTQTPECSIYPAVCDIMTNLGIPGMPVPL